MSALAELNIMPFNDIRSLINNMPDIDLSYSQNHDSQARSISDNVDNLGILNELSRKISILQNRYPPMVLKPEIAVFVSTQSVENALDKHHKEKILSIIEDLKSGKHLVNQACNVSGCALKTYDLNTEIPTEDIRTESAMTEVEATQIIAYSMEAVRDTDLLVISEISSNHKIAAYSLAKALYPNELSEYPFDNTVQKALNFHGLKHNPLEFLRRLGSREIAAMVGSIIAARYQNVPVILDGISSLVAASIIKKINPEGINHCLLGHAYNDDIHNFLANELDLRPIAYLDIALDAGVGSTIAVHIIKTAIAIHNFTNK